MRLRSVPPAAIRSPPTEGERLFAAVSVEIGAFARQHVQAEARLAGRGAGIEARVHRPDRRILGEEPEIALDRDRAERPALCRSHAAADIGRAEACIAATGPAHRHRLSTLWRDQPAMDQIKHQQAGLSRVGGSNEQARIDEPGGQEGAVDELRPARPRGPASAPSMALSANCRRTQFASSVSPRRCSSRRPESGDCGGFQPRGGMASGASAFRGSGPRRFARPRRWTAFRPGPPARRPAPWRLPRCRVSRSLGLGPRATARAGRLLRERRPGRQRPADAPAGQEQRPPQRHAPRSRPVRAGRCVGPGRADHQLADSSGCAGDGALPAQHARGVEDREVAFAGAAADVADLRVEHEAAVDGDPVGPVGRVDEEAGLDLDVGAALLPEREDRAAVGDDGARVGDEDPAARARSRRRGDRAADAFGRSGSAARRAA